MNAKLLAFAALVISGATASGIQERSWTQEPSPAAAVIVLLPETLGVRSVSKRWNNRLLGGGIEEGALYDGVSGMPVQLDFFRNRHLEHNGIGCYLREGESLAWERLQALQVADMTAKFDVALLSNNDSLRLVAATECSPKGCIEHGLWGDPLGSSQLRWHGVSTTRDSVVPVSIMLSSPLDGEDPAAVEARLMSQLEDVARLIDLAPAQKLASLQ